MDPTGNYPEGWTAESWDGAVAEEVAAAIAVLPTADGPRRVAMNTLAKEYAITPEWIESQL